MIRFIADINKFPNDLSWDYALESGVEGDFAIEIDNKDVFKTNEFLILEFFFDFHKWICDYKTSNLSDYYFVSMDEEEEPIVAFYKNKDTGLYDFDSVWKLADGSATIEEIYSAYRELMVRLQEQSFAKYKYDLRL
jgi:hypothetical protein